MNAPESLPKSALYLAETHEVVNVARPLGDYNPNLATAGTAENRACLSAAGSGVEVTARCAFRARRRGCSGC
jgi:hypothetical protein